MLLVCSFKQLYIPGCLGKRPYYIESEGEAAIMIPSGIRMNTSNWPRKSNAGIKYIFETHFHADFVGGHIDLAKKTGAQIIYGNAATNYRSAYNSQDGELFKLGKLDHFR